MSTATAKSVLSTEQKMPDERYAGTQTLRGEVPRFLLNLFASRRRRQQGRAHR